MSKILNTDEEDVLNEFLIKGLQCAVERTKDSSWRNQGGTQICSRENLTVLEEPAAQRER